MLNVWDVVKLDHKDHASLEMFFIENVRDVAGFLRIGVHYIDFFVPNSVVFRNCYYRHLKNGACENLKICDICGKFYKPIDGEKVHTCGLRFCKKCNTHHLKSRGCFIKKLKTKEDPPDYRIVCFN